MEVVHGKYPIETANLKPGAGDPLIWRVADQSSEKQAPAESAAGRRQNMALATEREVAAGTVPQVDLEHDQSQLVAAKPAVPHHWYDSAGAVLDDLETGVGNEWRDHKLRLAAYFTVGFGAAAALAALSGTLALGATAVGLGMGAYQLYKKGPGWVTAAEEVAHPEGHTQVELERAHHMLQDVGAGTADVAAAILGGGTYRVGNFVWNKYVSAGTAGAAVGTDGGASNGAAAPDDGSASHGAADVKSAPVQPGDTTAGGDKVVAAAAHAETNSVVDLDNPAGNTSEPALRAAFRKAIASALKSDEPMTFKVDTTVQLTDGAGNPSKLTQSDVLLEELKSAAPDRHFVFSKPDLSPGDPGYTEVPAPVVAQDGLHLSSKENAITLVKKVVLPDGSELPEGTKFAVGTTFDGNSVRSALPDGKVWAVRPDGTYVPVADAGQATPIPPESISSDPRLAGQVISAKTPDNFDNHIIVRTDAKAVDPDGKAMLDVYSTGGKDFDEAWKPGTQPGFWAPRPKTAEHFLLPSHITVEANTPWGAATALGSRYDYFMRSGFADAMEATAKNYSGPAQNAQSAAELLRILKLLELAPKSA